ncbi:oleosin 16.4 kDa [Populus alba x Populus x berolinensis]|nr:oleosin 16.4 kDa [Populus alba x Populus x berolinensis]KAJ6869021.1 oleosin 16.4 kDa [Populus alba x Populus x berolinensis]
MADFRQQQLRPGFWSLLPIGGTLLFLAGLTLVGTLTGLAVATPLFVIFSPVLVPAALVIGLGVLGFLKSGAFGLTALSSLSRMASYIRSLIRGQVGHKARETGQIVQSKAQEVT